MCEEDGHCIANQLLVCNNVTKQCECSDTTFEYGFELIFTNLISEKLGNLLILDDPVISNFRILPKRDQMILTDINKIIF